MPGGCSRWCLEHRRTLAVRTAHGVWATPKRGHQWKQRMGALSRWQRQWVGSGRVALAVRLPNPPVRTVLAAFIAHGSRHRGILRVTCISSGVHRVHGVQLARSLSNLRSPTLSLGAFAMYGAFLHSDYYAPSVCLAGPWTFRHGSPLPTSTVLLIPFRLSRVRIEGLQQDGLGGVLSFVPSALCGFPVVIWGKTGFPISPAMN